MEIDLRGDLFTMRRQLKYNGKSHSVKALFIPKSSLNDEEWYFWHSIVKCKSFYSMNFASDPKIFSNDARIILTGCLSLFSYLKFHIIFDVLY